MGNASLDFSQQPNVAINVDVAGPPVFTSANSATFTVTAPNSFQVTSAGFPAPNVHRRRQGGLPGGVSFNVANGILSGTPAPGTINIYHDTFTAANGSGTVTQVFTLTVTGVPTSTTLTDQGPNPSFAGNPVTFTAAVNTFVPITGEKVYFEDASNGNATVGSGTLSSSGTASCTISSLTAGSHSIFAVYFRRRQLQRRPVR